MNPRTVLSRIVSRFRRRRFEVERSEELRVHPKMRAEANRAEDGQSRSLGCVACRMRKSPSTVTRWFAMSKPITTLLCLLCLSAGAFAAGTEGKESASVRNVILAPYSYGPVAHPGKAHRPVPSSSPGKSAVPENEPVTMPTMYVHATRLPPPGSKLEPLPALRPFDWESGGTIYKHVGRHVTTELKPHYDLKRNHWSFLSFSW